MEAIRTYLLRVIAAAMICSIISALSGKSGLLPNLIKLLSGVFLTLVLVNPLAHIQLSLPTGYVIQASDQADEIAFNAKLASKKDMSSIIKSQTEAYILDKAANLGVQVSVAVTLDDSDYPVPVSAQICGNLSPYAKRMLSDVLSRDLGIPAEDQKWN